MKQQLQIRVVFDRVHVATLSDDPQPRPGLIQLEARYNGRKVYRAIARVYLDQFGRYNRRTHTTTGETVHNRADAERINREIHETRAAALADFDRCRDLGITYTLDRFTATTPGSTSPAFLPWASTYVENMPVCENTRIAKRTFVKTIAATGIFHTLADLTAANVLSFDRHLKEQTRQYTTRPLSPGYVHNVHGFLHTLSREALRLGHITADPYANFSNPKAKAAPRPFLTPDQIQLIATAPCIDFAGTHFPLRDARDLFMLQIYTGLARVDVQNAPWSTARTSGILRGQRTKTRTPYIIRINPAARAILDRWAWVPPSVTEVSLNEALQLIVCQAITGLPYIGLRNIHKLPPSVVEILRRPSRPGTSSQLDVEPARLALLCMIDTGKDYATLRAAGLMPDISRPTLTNHLRRLIVQSVIPALSTHIGRHTFATAAINANVPVAVLQKILGHTNPNTTLVYAKLQADTIASAFDQIDAITDPNKKDPERL